MEKLQTFCLQVCKDISSGLENYLGRLPESYGGQKSNGDDALHKCGPASVNLLWRQANLVSQKQGDWALLKRRLDDLISVSKRKFYAYPFKDVPECWLRLFTDSSLVKACSLVLESRLMSKHRQDVLDDSLRIDHDKMDAIVATLDLAIIMA